MRHDEWVTTQWKARKLLEHLVGEEAYKKFLVTGFIEVPSKLHPGWIYLVAANGGGVHLRQVGWPRLMAHLCVYVPSPFPDDDGTAAIYLMAKHQEEALIANSKATGWLPR